MTDNASVSDGGYESCGIILMSLASKGISGVNGRPIVPSIIFHAMS